MQSCFDSADAKKHHSPTCTQAKKQKGAGAHGGCPILWVIVTIPAMLNFSGSDPPMHSKPCFFEYSTKGTYAWRSCNAQATDPKPSQITVSSSQVKANSSHPFNMLYIPKASKISKKNLKYCGRHSATAAPSSKFINWIKCLKATGQNYINWKLQISTCSTNTKLNTKKHITAGGHLSFWKNALQQNQQNSPIQSKPKIQSNLNHPKSKHNPNQSKPKPPKIPTNPNQRYVATLPVNAADRFDAFRRSLPWRKN